MRCFAWPCGRACQYRSIVRRLNAFLWDPNYDCRVPEVPKSSHMKFGTIDCSGQISGYVENDLSRVLRLFPFLYFSKYSCRQVERRVAETDLMAGSSWTNVVSLSSGSWGSPRFEFHWAGKIDGVCLRYLHNCFHSTRFWSRTGLLMCYFYIPLTSPFLQSKLTVLVPLFNGCL